MFDFTVTARLERRGILLMDEDIAEVLESLDAGNSLKGALRQAAVSSARFRRWRRGVLDILGEDPMRLEGRRLRMSDLGRRLLEEYRARNAALRVHLASGMRVPLLAVDGLVLYKGRLVAIRRRYYPFQGLYCLPGGIVEYGERVEDAVVREVKEETGLETRVHRLVGVYSDLGRDPRGHVISLAFELEVLGGELVSGSDASVVALLDLEDLPEMGFDHRHIVEDFLRLRKAA